MRWVAVADAAPAVAVQVWSVSASSPYYDQPPGPGATWRQVSPPPTQATSTGPGGPSNVSRTPPASPGSPSTDSDTGTGPGAVGSASAEWSGAPSGASRSRGAPPSPPHAHNHPHIARSPALPHGSTPPPRSGRAPACDPGGRRMRIERGREARDARDLGGAHPTVRPGAFVRGDQVSALPPAGWDVLRAHGVRAVVDLRSASERDQDRTFRADLTRVPVDLDGPDDAWRAPWRAGPQFGSPLSYRPHVAACPERLAAALVAIAEAPPGGVRFRCVAGRDRTGMVAAALLRLLDVPVDAIVADDLASEPNVAAARAARGRPDPSVEVRASLAARGEVLEGALAAFVTWPELRAHLAGGGLRDGRVAALRARGAR